MPGVLDQLAQLEREVYDELRHMEQAYRTALRVVFGLVLTLIFLLVFIIGYATRT